MSFEFWTDFIFQEDSHSAFPEMLLPVEGSLDDIAASPHISSEDVEPPKSSYQWTAQEDELLLKLAKEHKNDWKTISKHFPEKKQSQVQRRWTYKYGHSLKRFKWTPEEDEMIIDFYLNHGSNWKLLAKQMNNKTPEMIKNRFYGTLKKRSRKNNKENEDPFSLGKNGRYGNLEEKQKKVQELYGKMAAIEAFIIKTQSEINTMNKLF